MTRQLPKDSELAREQRRQRALQRLGGGDPRCVFCGEDDPHCLELHHLAGQAYDDTTGILCRNCHRKASDLQRDHPARITKEPDTAEQIGHFLLGLADLFVLLVAKLREFGVMLIESAADPDKRRSLS